MQVGELVVVEAAEVDPGPRQHSGTVWTVCSPRFPRNSELAALESGRIDSPPSVNVDATRGPNFLGVPAKAPAEGSSFARARVPAGRGTG